MVEERRGTEVEGAVRAFRAAGPEERAAMNATLSREDAARLAALAREAAEHAVRQGDEDRIRFGLAAVALEGGWPDWRDTLITLTLLHVSARKIGLDADRLFEDEASALAYEPAPDRAYFSNAGAKIIRSFAGRPARLKELDVMCHEEYDGPDGFAYRSVEDA
jgi:hypothetical protein